MAWLRRIGAIVAGLLLGVSGLTQESPPKLHGTWTATGGTQTFRGTWGAEVSPGSPDAAQGYWTLENDAGERVLEGTWSARKTRSRWQGTWTARTAQGRSFSGTWDSDSVGAKAKTLGDMLAQTLEKEIAGSWQSDRYSGNWWLSGSKNGEKRR